MGLVRRLPIIVALLGLINFLSSLSHLGRSVILRPSGTVWEDQGCQVKEPADELPGAFTNNRLYLQGARLTTSFDTMVDVHVDLFGCAGDFTRPMLFKNVKMIPCNESSGLNETLLNFDDIYENVTLFCQLQCSGNRAYTSAAIPMALTPTKSSGPNQNRTTIIWRCNITDYMDKHDLLKEVDHLDKGVVPAVRVHFSMQYQGEPLVKIATIDIPLDTGVAGRGGPQIRGNSSKSYFLQQPVPVGLCVQTYEHRILDYMEEFVQHHLNVGFGSIVIGVFGSEDSDNLKRAQRILKKYIDTGVVVLAYNGLPWGCNVNIDKMQFYQTCLYYHKGITKYSATWDMDEYWIPPKILHMDGRHDYEYEKWGVGQVKPTKAVNDSRTINASHWSTFPQMARDDPLWQGSNYSISVSIGDTMTAIDKHYIENNCANSWCFHMFPSHQVKLKDPQANRTKKIGKDFDRLQPREYNVYQKSIVNTKYAHMAGIHKAGDCLFESINASLPATSRTSLYHVFAAKSECNPNRFHAQVYGSIHHFFSLLSIRGQEKTKKKWTVDEYVQSYASTVEQQLHQSGTLQ